MKKRFLRTLLGICLALCCAVFVGCDRDTHKHVCDEKIVVAPTCTERGYTIHRCECGEQYIDSYVKAIGHSFTTYVSDNNATCTKDGTKTAHCDREGCNATDTIVGEEKATGHNYLEEWTYNNSYHWHDCKNEGCTETIKIMHDFNKGTCSVCGAQYVGSEGLSYALINDDNEYCVNGIGTCTDTDIVIPLTYNGKRVTSIRSYAFANCTSLTSITTGIYVETIGEKAFYDCKSLVYITIGNNVRTIGAESFDNCTSLTSITLGNNVKSMGKFKTCTSLTSINVADGNLHYKSIDGNLYSKDGTELIQYAKGKTDTSFIVPDSVTSIRSEAFYGCNSLTSITIPDSVTSIGNYAFYCCTSLTSITIPDSVTSIRDHAFYDCRSLTSITIPDSVTSIGDHAFYDCRSLTSITIPDSVTSIGGSAFDQCSALTSVMIGNSVTSIGNYAFFACPVTSITIPDSVTSIGINPFYDCSNLSYNEYDNAYYLGNDNNPYLALIMAKSQDITSCSIHDDCKVISGNAFQSCSFLTCITIPDGETSIGSRAFAGCTLLTSITIPGSVTNIGDYAFVSCDSLAIATIDDGVTSIEEGAFWSCRSLTSITIPDSVTSIGSKAFQYCNSLIEVINNSSLNITKGSYDYGYVGYYALNVKHDGTSDIVNKDGYLFYTYGEKNYLLGYIGTDTALTLPANYNGESYGIYKCAFDYRYSLTNITIPDGVTGIGEDAFAFCVSLTSIIIPNSVTGIGEDVFYNCTSLASVTIPDGVTIIRGEVFYNCISLTSVTIPVSVTKIESEAFAECTSLTSITYTGTIEQWLAISKLAGWKYNVPSTCIVHCTDGDVGI